MHASHNLLPYGDDDDDDNDHYDDDEEDLQMQFRMLESRKKPVVQTAHSARLLVELHVQPLWQLLHTGTEQRHQKRIKSICKSRLNL